VAAGIWDDDRVTVSADSPVSAAGRPTSSPAALRWFGRAVEGWTLTAIGRAGLAGTILIALGSFGAGALPANDPTRHLWLIGLLRHGSAGLHVALGMFYLGLVVLVGAWLLLGRLLLTGSAVGTTAVGAEVVSPITLRRVLIRWMAPLLLGMPLASSDLYSYAAQAQLARYGLDPYTRTPADLPAVDLGKFLDNVAWKWVDTPSPYGPLWVAVSKWVAAATGNHALISVLLLRLLPFAAVVITARLLPILAQQFNKRADLALWIAVANPLILVHAVAGGHNDAVMVVLMVGGLVVITRPGAGWRHLLGGVALMTLAAAVKSPGLIGVAFAVPIFVAARSTPSFGKMEIKDWLRHCAVALAIVVPVFTVVSLVAGVGLGWARQVSSGVPVINFMSLPTLLAVLYRAITGAPHAGTVVDSTVRDFRNAGAVASVALLAWLWFKAVRGAYRRQCAMGMLALALLSVVLLGPAVQPWYFSWALTVAAVLLFSPRSMFWVATVSIALTLLTRPMGSSLEASAYIPAVLAAALAARSLLGPVTHREGTAA
jgi:alpha-1,6-mannosyltransferase